MISVTAQGEGVYEVVVQGASTTTHRVTVQEADYQRLTGGSVTPEVLLETSFRFLLERESNTSILRSFDLMVIGRYFPEYETVLADMLAP